MDGSRGKLIRPRSVQWDHLSHMVAGVSGGVVATLVLHPLDLVKIRFQGIVSDIIYRLPCIVCFIVLEGFMDKVYQFKMWPDWCHSDDVILSNSK